MKECNMPSICGVGFIGKGIHKHKINGKITKEYQTWRGMLQRCYSPQYHKKYPTYSDCSVDERWHNFQNFCEDIQHLVGYKEWKENKIPYAWALDKDIRVPGNKVYSRDTCAFVTISDNSKEMHERINGYAQLLREDDKAFIGDYPYLYNN